jgi:hypothetical protein
MTQIIRLEIPELKSEMTLRWDARSAHPIWSFIAHSIWVCATKSRDLTLCCSELHQWVARIVNLLWEGWQLWCRTAWTGYEICTGAHIHGNLSTKPSSEWIRPHTSHAWRIFSPRILIQVSTVRETCSNWRILPPMEIFHPTRHPQLPELIHGCRTVRGRLPTELTTIVEWWFLYRMVLATSDQALTPSIALWAAIPFKSSSPSEV